MNIKQSLRKISFFDVITILIASIVILFILSVVVMLIFKGIASINKEFFSKEIIFALTLSLSTASISTIVCLLFGIPTAYVLTKTKIPFKRFFEVLIELPLSLPNLVLGLSLLLIFASPFGKMLSEAGFRVIFSKAGIVMAHTLVNLPFVIRMIKTAFRSVDKRLEFIAQSLGASKFKSFLLVTLPLSRNAIVGAVILAWSRALGEFGATLMVVGVTRMKTETLPASIYLNIATGDMGAAMSSAVILLIISAASLFLFNCFQKDMR
ncbi:ABC transporter permease [Anaerovorax odorimutans]|uniref:ABC transporter permease n=1 Tax=Anaerovorax odorimutans TaxID=109327 RepID=UPI00040BD103|nr:ABC transporter permease [Anaerovorax odorimutans]